MYGLLFSLAAWAHKPSFGDGFTSAESAYTIEDPNISIVVYQEVTCEESELWMAFDAQAGFEFYVQLGVPVVDWLETYVPTVAVIAPGLPEDVDVPFDLPEGMGGIVYQADSEPQAFYEPFTQTSSWIWVEERLILPESGQGYVVGWHEGNQTGKLWIATGEVEDFSDVSPTDFIYWDEAVNDFHETGEYGFVEPKESLSCGGELEAESEEENAKTCASMGAQPFWALAALGLAGVALRRRESD